LAIRTYAKLTGRDLGTSSESEPITFTLYQDGEVKTVVTVQDGEVTVENDFEINNTKVSEATQAVADETAAEAAEAAANTTGTATVPGGVKA